MFRLSSRRILLCASSTTAAPSRASWASETSTSAWGTAPSPSSSTSSTTTSSWYEQQQPAKISPDIDSVLEVIRQDAGETAKYYADKYFDGKEVKVSSILWNNLKKFGHVDIDRSGGGDPSASPRWFPSARYPRRGPRVSHYREEDNDLSVLKEYEAEETANAVASLLDASAGDDAENPNKSSTQDDVNYFNTKTSAFGNEMQNNTDRAPDVVSAPAETGWGSLSNTGRKVRAEGFKARSSNTGGGGASWGKSSVNNSREQRWKADISRLQRSALQAPARPKAPWS